MRSIVTSIVASSLLAALAIAQPLRCTITDLATQAASAATAFRPIRISAHEAAMTIRKKPIANVIRAREVNEYEPRFRV